MADEIPPAPSESSDDVTKSETIRITLPPKSEQPAIKRETVRINVPGKPVAPVGGTAPKKETTKLQAAGGAPPAAGGTKPFVPPPPAPKPPGAPSAPAAPPLKPAGGSTPPPKPPGIGVRPTVPLKPAPGPGGSTPGTEPITQKAAAPKKETARITLPPEGSRAPLPKATVKMQQTQPLVNRPAAAITPASPISAASATGDGEADPMLTPLSIAAVVLSLVAVIFTYLAYSAASVS